MPRFSANLSMLFTEHAFLDRFTAAARAGFRAVEYVGPYDHPAPEIAARLADNGLTQALFNLPLGDWEKGDRGLAVLRDRAQEFRASIDTAISYATALRCTQVNCMAGLAPAGRSPELDRFLVENLRFAADKLRDAGIRLLIEPINDKIDIPGFYLNTSAHALEIIERVGSDNLFLQYDVYHMQIMEGDLARTIETNLDRIAHIQIADTPGRHEPGTGEINYPFLLTHLDRIGYTGWIGAEYRPQAGTEAGLGWLKTSLPVAAETY